MTRHSDNLPDETKFNAIHLWTDGKYVYVEVEVNKKWVQVIRELKDSSFSHIVEPSGIARCVQEAPRV